MRLLFLTNFYPPYERGGYEQLCQEVAKALVRRNHVVAVLTSKSDVNPSVVSNNGESVYRLLNTEVDMRPYRGAFDFFFGRKQRLQETISCFQEVVADFQPDILFVWGMWNLPRQILTLAEGMHYLRVVYYIADYWPVLPDAYTLHWQEQAKHWYTSLPKTLVGWIALRMLTHTAQPPALGFKHAICVSKAVRQQLVEAGLPLNNAQVIYNGIELEPFLAAQKSRRRQASEPLKLLYAGRISPEKGVHTAIEAVARLVDHNHQITLTIVGSGPSEYLRDLAVLCERLGVVDKVVFRGRVHRSQMPDTLAQFDVLVFPSVWAEPLPRIVQEAMATGLVVIGSNVGGMPEILEDGVNGLTFVAGDACGLAEQVEKLISNANLRRRLTDAALNTVREKFDIQRMIDEIEAYLVSVQ